MLYICFKGEEEGLPSQFTLNDGKLNERKQKKRTPPFFATHCTTQGGGKER